MWILAAALMVAMASTGQGGPPVAHARPIGTLAASASPEGRAARREPGSSLPDTVLARIGASRLITRASFQRQWQDTHGGAPLDSLTPAAARRFLELLIDRELLAEAASGMAWSPTPEESAQLVGLADRMAMSMALESLLVGTRAAGDARPAPSAQRGIDVRDSIVGGLAPELDRALLDRLARAWAALPRMSADSSIAAQLRMMERLPRVDAPDTARVVARSGAGDVRVGDLLDAWRRLPAVYRPRVETADQMEDLVRNALFERVLRARAAEWGFARQAGVRAVIERQRENLAIARFVEGRIGRIEPDERAITRWFEKHRADYAVPTRVQMVRLSFGSRETAARMAAMLRDAAEADSLAARAERSGIPYRVRVSAAADSVLYRAALRAGTGAVVGPIESRGEWVVARIEAILPGRPRELSEVRAEAEARWIAEENERRLEALALELARTTPVSVNDRAVRAAVTRK